MKLNELNTQQISSFAIVLIMMDILFELMVKRNKDGTSDNLVVVCSNQDVTLLYVITSFLKGIVDTSDGISVKKYLQLASVTLPKSMYLLIEKL